MKTISCLLSKPLLTLMWLLLIVSRAPAHPMGNFSINHYARFEATPAELKWRTVLDFAEIATAERMAGLDLDANGKVSEGEKQGFLRAQAVELGSKFSLSIDGQPTEFSLRPVDLTLPPGAGGLPTLRLIFSSRVPWPKAGGTQHRIEYRDDSFEGRTGWKEIVAQGGAGATIQKSTASPRDISRELTVFPDDATLSTPTQTEAAFTVALAATGTPPSTSTPSTSTPSTSTPSTSTPSTSTGVLKDSGASRTPQNLFTQSIAERDLTPGAMMLGLLVALAFGAIHALSPGHGKTMVAAYLVGTRGTPRHAALLGLVVTITHTMGVFALGLITLFATNYIVPERLYPILSMVSGLLILGVGFWLLLSRVQDLQRPPAQPHHEHSHDEEHSHDHSHEHDHSHSHEGVTHTHGGRAHTHAVPEGPVTARALVALGISGGIVPCPEALVVLLAAVRMGRIGYGLGLITAFSIGLAAALIAIGLSVVAARRHLSRWERVPAAGALMRYLPVVSAAVITLIGIALTLQASDATP